MNRDDVYLLKWGWSFSTLGPNDEHYEELWSDRAAAEARVEELTATLTRMCGIRSPTTEELAIPAIRKAMDEGAWGVSDYRPPHTEIVALSLDSPASVSVEDRRRNP